MLYRLGKPRPTDHVDTDGRREHAVVIGASIAGLLNARVLADTFDRVTVLERDTFTGSGDRKGAPQSLHIHGLMDRGRQIMDELFPGLTEELVAAGTPRSTWLEKSRWYLGGLSMLPNRQIGLTLATPSRALLENSIRARLQQWPNVEMRERQTVTGVLTSGRDRIVGVRLGDGTETRADLVVDASGRGSQTADWLAALGHERIPEDRVGVDLGYSSRMYRRRPGDLDGDQAIVVSCRPGSPGAAILAVEDDRWHVTLSGTLGVHPPTDPDAYLDYAAALPVPDVHELIRDAEPLTAPVRHRVPDSVRRRYEKLAAPPRGLLVTGDAVTSFNPVYAQGMSVAAQEAVVLRDYLRTTDTVDPREFYRRIARVVDAAWGMSTAIDLRSPRVSGRRSWQGRIFGAYVQRAQLATSRDPYVTRAVLRVLNLTRRPRSLLTPPVAARVLRTMVEARLGRSAPGRPRPTPASASRPETGDLDGPLIVTDRVQGADDVAVLTLAQPDRGQLPVWAPGAHVDVAVPGVGTRQYSLCGDPADRTRWRIAVLRETDGRGGSRTLHDEVRPGSTLQVGGVRNNFPLVEAERHILLAGGIGITPLLPMAAHLEATGANWTLHYGGRQRSAMVFLDELPSSARCAVYTEDTDGLLPLVDILAQPRPNTAVYCCGPEGLLAAVETACATWPPGTVHVERFHPAPADPALVRSRAFDVVLARTGQTVPIPAGGSIIDELARAGVDIVSSCREGTCGSCETVVLDGDPCHRDSVLSDAERTSGNTMMPCVSTAASDTLVLDL